MGINIHVYTIYGIQTEWNDAFYADYERNEEELCDEFGYEKSYPADRQVDILIDGMGGNYFVFGPELYDSGDFRYCDKMNDYEVIDITKLEQYKQDYIEKFNRLFPNHPHLLEGKEWKLMNLIHYS